jgi:extracellular elastinolytic metalloproteinase
MNVPTPARRRRLAALAAAMLTAAGLIALTPNAEGQSRPVPAAAQTRVHWSNGQALAAPSSHGRAAAVRSYLAGHGVGRAAADSLRATGSAWSAHGVTYLRMKQYVDGLRVADSYAKAAFDARGRLIALIENTSPATSPRGATVSDGNALRVAIGSLYPGRAVDTHRTGKVGAVTTFARQGLAVAPTVEKVAVPANDRRLSVGYVVTTWDRANRLNETLVSGDGAVVRSDLRTAEDGYNIFPESPAVSAQTLVSNPADDTASPSGWLAGDQWSNHISGNNAEAYLDSNNDNLPDANDEPEADGIFDAVWDGSVAPSAGDNTDVAVQNLFYLNNLIHDTLYAAGFTEAAGNFQQDNFGRGGVAGDPVQAQAQDGGGTDNANFSTPPDGQDPRMQMYLWNVPGTHEVIQGGVTYQAAGASWGAQLNTTGRTGPLVVAADGVAISSDACEPIPAVAAGSIVIADRGNCDFVVKAKNAQVAGAAGIIVANNTSTGIFAMGGTNRRVTIPGVMVSQTDGGALKNPGAPTTIRLDPTPPPMVDGDLDSDIVWHEYGHGLTWRMIGQMGGPMSAAIGEGMSDVLSVIVNNDPEVAEYSFSDPLGLRSESYEGYSRTYGDIVGEEIHFDGEVYGAIGWDLWKNYQAAGLGQADILADLVGGMNFTPPGPAFEDMREGILMGLTASGHPERACMVWDSFAQFGVGVAADGFARGKRKVVTAESFAKPAECA